MEKKIIELKASYFKNTEYFSDNCPIGKAMWQQIGKKRWGIGICSAFVHNSDDSTNYVFRDYSMNMFQNDWKKAEKAGFSKDIIIRKIKIKLNE